MFILSSGKWKQYPIYVTAYGYFFGALFMGLSSMFYVAKNQTHLFRIPQEVRKFSQSNLDFLIVVVFIVVVVVVVVAEYLCPDLCRLHYLRHVLHAHHMVKHPPLCYHSNSILAHTGSSCSGRLLLGHGSSLGPIGMLRR